MECTFGKVVGERMVLNEYGKIARDEWISIGHRYANIKMDAYVVMPNHMHGIIEIVRAGSPRPAYHTHKKT